MKRFLAAMCCVLLLASCGGRNSAPETVRRAFPLPEVPTMISSMQERQEYLGEHYWDRFFEGDWVTDSAAVLGVEDPEVEKNMSTFILILQGLPMDRAQADMARLFRQIEDKQAADTSSLVYLRMTELVSKYLYDPNSPLRSEDFYLSFVEGLAKSRFTDDARRPGYEFELRMCSLNPYGSKAPDFEFKDASGRVHTLYGIDAGWTLLFFSNPGCHACQGIVSEIEAAGFPEEMIASGDLAVVNIYIDDEIDRWRAAAGEYPAGWYNGYDFRRVMNDGSLYYVRAIPSLYLLDADKRVIMKDAPTERVLAFLENAINS